MWLDANCKTEQIWKFWQAAEEGGESVRASELGGEAERKLPGLKLPADPSRGFLHQLGRFRSTAEQWPFCLRSP